MKMMFSNVKPAIPQQLLLQIVPPPLPPTPTIRQTFNNGIFLRILNIPTKCSTCGDK